MIRTKEEIAERSKLIRAATPDCLDELFEMQNRICDLCGQPIQDICLAELDHSIPVKYFAKGSLLIEEAVEKAAHKNNLRAAHCSCNTAKKISREEWYAKGLNNREIPHYFSETELEEFRKRIGSGGRIGGQVQGRINAENGHMKKMRDLPQTKEALLKQGRERTENGYMERMRNLPQTIEARRKAIENGHMQWLHSLPQTKRALSENGKSLGQKNVENGHIQALGRLHGRKNIMKNRTPEGCAKGARIVGKTNVENKRGIFAVGYDRSKNARINAHNYWHVKRGIIKIGCKLCESKEQQ